MAFPVIVFNNLTGSDTAASGAGPATAVTGEAAAHTNSSSSTTITLTNSPDLSEVSSDGSACLWLNTPSGRQFTKITGLDDEVDTLTVEDSFNISSGSPVDYAIGGKRREWACGTNRLLNRSDIKAGWSVDIEYTGTTYALTATAGGDFNNSQIGQSGSTTNGPITIFSSSEIKPTLSAHYGGAVAFTVAIAGSLIVLRNLHFQNNVSATSPQALRVNNSDLIVDNCTIDYNGVGAAVTVPDFSGGGTVVSNCRVIGGITFGSASGDQREIVITNTAVTGRIIIGRHQGVVVRNTISGGITLNHANLRRCVIVGNIVRGSTTSALIVVNPNIAIGSIVEDNIFTESANYGINFTGGSPLWTVCNRNAYYGNMLGEVSGVANGPNDITLTADPFVDAANGDFNLNDVAGGGASLRAIAVTLP